MLKFCPECGSKLIGGKFCSNCGADLTKYGAINVAVEDATVAASLDDALGNLMDFANAKQAEEAIARDFEIKDGVLIEYKGDGGDVVIPDGVTKIAERVFSFRKLKSIEIPESVEEIDMNGNFWMFRSLERIKISDKNKKIKYAGNCLIAVQEKKLLLGFDNSTIPNDGSVTSIGADAFHGCKGLRGITIPNGVTTIGNDAFAGCVGLTYIDIPNSAKGIGIRAFKGCSSLKKVTIGIGLISIGAGAFEGCKSLTNISIPDNVTEVESYAFFNCSIIEATVPAKAIDAIRKGNFSTLKRVVITSGTALNQDAFGNCTLLESVTIPPSIKSIGQGAFYNCKSLKEIHISDVAAWCRMNIALGGCPFYVGSANLYLNGKLLTHLIIPSGVTEIGDYTFSNCKSLTYVEMPDSVRTIGDSAFCDCKSLSGVELSKRLISIGANAFYNCMNLKSVQIPYSVRHIGKSAFVGFGGVKKIFFENTEGWPVSAYWLKEPEEAGRELFNSDCDWERQ